MVVYGVTLDTAEVAIALGIAVSMLFYEKQNLVPGGVIVPGYVALTLDRPYLLLSTFAVAIITVFALRKVAGHVVLFGRRKFSFMMLMSFVITCGIQSLVALALTYGQVASVGPAGIFHVIGIIIPELGANSMRRHSITKSTHARSFVSGST